MFLSSEDRRVPGLWMNGCSTSAAIGTVGVVVC